MTDHRSPFTVHCSPFTVHRSPFTSPWPRWLIGVALLGAVVTALWRLSAKEKDAAWERVQSQGEIVFATDATFPPFEALDANGDYFGFDVDLARAVAGRLGLRAGFDLVAYDGLIGSLVVARADAVLSALVEQPHRLDEAHFTRPYFNAGTVLVIPAGASLPDGVHPMRWAENRVLAVEYGAQGDVVARRWLKRVVGLRLLQKPGAAQALQAVAHGEADGALVDAVTAFESLSGETALQLAAQVEDVPYVIAVSAFSPHLRRELDRALGEMEADGSLRSLRARWFGEAARELRFVDGE